MQAAADRRRLIERALAALDPGTHVLSHHVGCHSSTLKLARGDRQFALRVREAADCSALRREFTLQQAAARRGCAPLPLGIVFTAQSIISEWAPGETAASTRVRRSRMPALVGAALARLHAGALSGRRAGAMFGYLITSTEDGPRAYAGFFDIARRAAAKLLSSRPRLVPIHGDVWPGNVVVGNQQCVLIDWECAGDGDPASDLACYSAGAALSRVEETRLLDAYLEVVGGRRGSRSLEDRIVLWKCVIAAVWLAWAFGLRERRDRRRWIPWATRRADHQIVCTARQA